MVIALSVAQGERKGWFQCTTAVDTRIVQITIILVTNLVIALSVAQAERKDGLSQVGIVACQLS